MKHNRKTMRLISAVLTAVLLLSMLTGCDNAETSGNPNNNAVSGGANVDVTNTGDFYVEGTTHIFNITATDEFLVKDGKCDYAVAISRDAHQRIQNAAKEFVNFFLEATGIYLQTVYAEDVQPGKYIVIGINALSEKAGLTPDEELLGRQGFQIKTVDSSIYIFGTGPEGAQYGTYELLTQLFDFDSFGADCYSLNTGVKLVPLMNYDITDVPDISIRADNYMFLKSDTTTRDRFRLITFGEELIAVDGTQVHNSHCYIDKADYPDKPEWFSTDGKNLCYTAHGNEEEKAQMQRIVADVMIDHFKKYPDRDIITMTHEDVRTLCECESCEVMRQHYNGAQSASVVIFLNEVCEMVEEYFKSEEGKQYDRDFTVLFFAYHATNQAPVTYDEATGTYAPIDEKVVLNEHLVPYFCESSGDYTKSFYEESEINSEIAENMRGWDALSDRLYFWMYSTNFLHFLTPYNTFDSTQATYKFAIERNADFIVDQGQSNQTGSATGWSWLKIYLYSKLTWNINQNMDELIAKFMENYFGPAGETMKAIFYEWKTFANYQSDVLGYSGARSTVYDALQVKLWDRQLLSDWTARMTQALEQVEAIKYEDYKRYNVYVKNISTERIAFNYLLLELFQPYMTQEAIDLAKEQLYHDQSLANIGLVNEPGSKVNDLLKSWGVF